MREYLLYKGITAESKLAYRMLSYHHRSGQVMHNSGRRAFPV